MQVLKLAGILYLQTWRKLLMIMYEASNLNTTDFPSRAIANDTFKEPSQGKNWLFTSKYGQSYIGFYHVSIFAYLSWLQAYKGVKN